MRSVLASLTAVVLAVSLVWVSGVSAQTQAPAPQAAPAAMDKQIEGKVKSLDPSGRTLTLEDGTRFMIPETVKVSQAELKPGAAVKVAYQEKGGQNVVTHLEVQR